MYLDFRVDFPSDPRTQLEMAIAAVFSSWNNPRAVTYRELNRIVGLKGTAVNVQARIASRTLFPPVSSCPLGGRFQGLIAKRRISTDDR